MKLYSNDELHKMNNADMIELIQDLQRQNMLLADRLAVATTNTYGSKSEKLEQLAGQIGIFNEAEASAVNEEPTIDKVVVVHRGKKKKGQRQEDLSKVNKEVINHELSEEELTALFGANGWERLADEVYLRLTCIPAVYTAEEHHVAVYKSKDGNTFARGNRPADLLRNSIATPSLVAAVMNAKYTNAMPLNRIAQELERNDVKVRRGVLANWVIRCSERYLSLVYDRMHALLCREHVVQADETTVVVTKDGRKTGCKSYMFVFRTSELSAAKPVILYSYEKTRGHDHAAEFLEDFNGILESDAFGGYKALDREEESIEAAFCWAHARRDFADALKSAGKENSQYLKGSVAYKALTLIAAIYNADSALKELQPIERQIRRQKEVKPLVEAYFAWVKEQNPAEILSEYTKHGLNYSLSNEKYLRKFLDDPMVPIDNSACERAIRPFTVGRANWHIIDTVHGAQASAVIYSIVETAKANNLKIYEYLKHLLTVIPEHMDDTNMDFLNDLMPWSENLPECCRKKLS